MKIPQHAAVFRKDIPKGPSLNKIHHYQQGALPVEYIHNAGKMRVLQPFEHVDLGHKPLLYHLKILAAVLSHLLDGPGLVGPLVDSHVHHAHAALAAPV